MLSKYQINYYTIAYYDLNTIQPLKSITWKRWQRKCIRKYFYFSSVNIVIIHLQIFVFYSHQQGLTNLVIVRSHLCWDFTRRLQYELTILNLLQAITYSSCLFPNSNFDIGISIYHCAVADVWPRTYWMKNQILKKDSQKPF